MRRRLVLTTALLACLSARPAAAAPAAVLDGRTKKSFTFTFALTDPQAHPLAETTGNPVDTSPETTGVCAKPRCYAVPFTMRPVRGVSPTTPLSVRLDWTLPTTRLWLMVQDVTKRTPATKGQCFGFFVTGGRSAVVRPDTVTGTVAYPAKHTVAPNPGPSPTELLVNGCNT